MVEQIEDFDSELKVQSLIQVKLAAQGQIKLGDPKPSQRVIPECALRPVQIARSKCSAVNSPSSTYRRIVNIESALR